MTRALQSLATIGLISALASTVSAYTVKSTTGGEKVHWRAAAIDLVLSPEVVEMFPDEDGRDAVVMASEAWRGLPAVPDLLVGHRLLPRGSTPHATDGVNGVYLSDHPLAGGRLAVTLATFDSATGAMIDADILLSPTHRFELLDEADDEDHRDHAPPAYDIASVLTHELGHVLGLGEAELDETATMWPLFGRGETHPRTLEIDDERGAMAVYRGISTSPEQVPLTCGTVSPGRTPPASGSPAGLVALPLALLIVRRRR